MMQMTSQGDIPNLIGKVQQVRHEHTGIEYIWQVSLLDGEFLLLDRGDNRLGEWLRIFLFHQSLDICTIDLLRGWIVLFIFV
jgi:hypothetical protein